MLVIISHLNTDFDSLASMYAISKLYPGSRAVFTGSPESNVRHFLEDYPEFSPKKEKQINANDVNQIIVVDTPSRKRLGNFELLLNKIQPILLIDHHPENENDFTAKQIVSEPTGATITIIIEMLIKQGVRLNRLEATLFAMGIYEDTGFFTYSNISAKDFKAMSYLFSCGADIRLIKKYVRHELNSVQFDILSILSERLETISISGLNIYFSYAEYDQYVEDLATVAQKLKQIYQIPILILVVKCKNKSYLIARSDDGVINCGKIASLWGGGGHLTSASSVINGDYSFIEIKTEIAEQIRKQIGIRNQVKNIMSYPVETVVKTETVKNARKKIHQIPHNSLVIVDKEKKYQGIISKAELEKAMHHRLETTPVNDLMSSDLVVVQPDNSIKSLIHLIKTTQQRKFPVIQNDLLVGIVTANDLLDSFVNEQSIPDEYKTFDQNIASLMEQFFSDELIEILKNISQVAQSLNYNIYLVGGVVRDMILGRYNDDIDIVVEGDTEHLTAQYIKQFGGRRTIYPRFHTATLVTHGEHKIDFASARIEIYEHPAALPEVEKSSLRYDLYRRDFSINTLAVSLNKSDFGFLIDYFSGRRDLSLKLIKILHNLSFIEDPTRIIRAIRFEQRFGFKIAEQTMKLMVSALNNKMLKKISAHRLQDEFLILLKEENPLLPLKRMEQLRVFQQFPFKLTIGEKALNFIERIYSFIHWYKMLYTNEKCDFWLVYLYAILFYIDDNYVWNFFKEFTFSNKVKDDFKVIKKRTAEIERFLIRESIKNSELYFFLENFDTILLLFFLSFFEDGVIRQNIIHYMTELRQIKIGVKGRNLIEWGMKQGTGIKKVLQTVLKARLDQEITPAEEIEYAKSIMNDMN